VDWTVADIRDDRRNFNASTAPHLAERVGARRQWSGKGSSRFAYFTSKSRFVIVAGPQEGSNAELALAFGLTYRKDLRLTLILPKGSEFPTLQRSAWLNGAARPHVFVHSRGRMRQVAVPKRKDTIAEFERRLGRSKELSDDLRDATSPAYLGQRSAAVTELVDWATTHLRSTHRTVAASEHGSASDNGCCRSRDRSMGST
jgi:hypothetical protein